MTNTRKNLDVLVIDDDYDMVEVLSEYLKLRSINVLAKGYTGKDAVELYQKYRPDVVLMDVMMPEYDGLYALEKIKKINPNAIVVMITANLSQKTEQRLNELNASSIFYKPFDIQQILERIDKLVLGVMKS